MAELLSGSQVVAMEQEARLALRSLQHRTDPEKVELQHRARLNSMASSGGLGLSQ
ncbi:MAG: hypothetical protein AAGE92_02895 [Cyanobacteria bacterium P01_G01_bin.4]